MTGFDLEERTVTAMRPDRGAVTIPYDSLIVAGGAGQSYFGHDEFSHWAPGMKTIDDALEIRGRILGAFEMAVLEEDPEKRREWLTFVVVGGGPTGVEIAGQIAELSRRVLPEDFHTSTPRAPACCCTTEARRCSPASAIGSPRRRRRSSSAWGWRYTPAASSRTSTATGSR